MHLNPPEPVKVSFMLFCFVFYYSSWQGDIFRLSNPSNNKKDELRDVSIMAN